MSTDGSIVYYRTPKPTHVFKLSALCLFILGVWMVVGGTDAQASLIERIAAIFSFLGFGACAWISGRRWKRRHRVYAINHDGFSLADTTGQWALSVDWKEVQGVAVSDFGYGNTLTFAFRDPKAVLSRMTDIQRKRAEDNEAMGIPTLTIPQSALDTPVDDVRNVSTRFFFAAG